MRFALLGDHLDGLDMARVLVASGRHELAAYTGQPVRAEALTLCVHAADQTADSAYEAAQIQGDTRYWIDRPPTERGAESPDSGRTDTPDR
jgi:hypothetical protein